jgi:integrase
MYRTYTFKGVHYPDGIWVRQINRYKTRESYGKQDIILRNRLMGDGRWLYEYLENYLYGEWYTGSFKDSRPYTWWDPELKGRRGRWLTPGVMAFEPVRQEGKIEGWPWIPCFPIPDTGNEHDRSSMTGLVGRAAHEWTGKRTTPHLMRRIWATWAFQIGLDDKAIHSLAYAMGTSYKTLKTWYEDATPEDKRRAIEETIDEFFGDYLDQVCEQGAWSRGETKSVELRKVLQLLPQLSAEDRKTVQQVLGVG